MVDGGARLRAVNVGDDFKIKVVGVNSVGSIGISNDESYDATAGKYLGYSSAVEFTGDGSLTVNQEKASDNAVAVKGQGDSSDAGRVVVDQGVNVKFYNDDAKKDARAVLGHDATETSGHGVVSVGSTGIASAANAIQFKGLTTQPTIASDSEATADIQACARYVYDLSDVSASDIKTADYTYTRNGTTYVAFSDDDDDDYYYAYRVIGAPEGQSVKVYDDDYGYYNHYDKDDLEGFHATATTDQYVSSDELGEYRISDIYQDANGANYILKDTSKYDEVEDDDIYVGTKVYALQGLKEESVTVNSGREWDADWAVYVGDVTRTVNKDAYYDYGYEDTYTYSGYTQLKKTYAQGYYNYDIAAETVEQGTVVAPATQADYNDVKAQLDTANANLETVKKQADDNAAALKSARASVKAAEKELAKYATSVTTNAKTFKVSTISAATAKGVKTLTLGKKVKKLSKGSLKNFKKLTTIVVKSTKLSKKSVKSAFKGNKLKKLTVKVPAKQLKKYKKAFTAKNLGVKKVTVTKA